MSDRYLVTGASGLLGHFLVPYLVAQGHSVIALANTHDLPDSMGGVRPVKCDITQKDQIEGVLNKAVPDIIIHAAGMTSVDQCETDPARARLMNTGVPVWLAQWAAKNGRQYVFISSDHVTGGDKPLFSETDPVAPVNIYAQTKLDAEIAVSGYAPFAQIVRTNFFGRGPVWRKSLTDWLWEKALAGEQIPAFTDSFFSPLSVHYLSRAIADLSRQPASGIFHVGGSERVSKYDFALQFLAFFNLDTALVVPSSVQDAHLAAPRPMDMSMAVGKVEQTLGYRMPTLKQSFESIKDDYKR